MVTSFVRLALVLFAFMIAGCGSLKRFCVDECGNGKHQVKPTVNSRTVDCGDPVLEAAACLTEFEDDLRRDGTITVKTPDVWGDRNLMHWIQEFDEQLTTRVGTFTPTIQGIDAISDNAKVTVELQAGTPGDDAALKLPDRDASQLSASQNAFEALTALGGALGNTTTLTLEPTEQIRQEATYVYVNQALRRKNMGGDNTRQAGYGLYLFRIPVSVLPGAETSQGFAAIANFRARTVVTPADVKFTLPRMAVAELVDVLGEFIEKNWDTDPKTTSEINAEDIKKMREWLHGIDEQTRGDLFIAVRPEIEQQIETIKGDFALLESPDQNSSDELECIRLRVNQAAKELAKAVNRVNDPEIAALQAIVDNTVTKSSVDPELLSLLDNSNSFKTYRLPNGVQDQQPHLQKNTLESLANDTKTKLTELRSIQAEANQVLDITSKMAFARSGEPVRIGPVSLVQDVAATASAVPQIARLGLGPNDYIYALRYLKEEFQSGLGGKPKRHEVRDALFNALLQITNHLERTDAITYSIPIIENAAKLREVGKSTELNRCEWISFYKTLNREGDSDAYLSTAWLVARQYGIVDLNLKRMLDEMEISNPCETDNFAHTSINFFNKAQQDDATKLWNKIVTQEFPLQVFTLEPEVEEQNVVEAMSRIREMQLALALSVAQGGWNAAQRVNMARRLARDAASIGLNRTIVGFVHGADAFGWYFYPRVQPPEPERSNLGVFAKTCFTAGPSPAEDIQTRRIEPGIRECEVLIAMPSFVQQVEFEVTTNWESLACPGKPKRSYQEMLAQSAKWQHVRQCVEAAECLDIYRPRDCERLRSRAEQLENMLGMQTHSVSVPFEFEQTATDLFDTGDRHLVPVLHGYYGLKYLVVNKPKDETTAAQAVTAEFFITGRNFHPTQTHVIVGGHESHKDGIEILSRELIKVRVEMKESRLSDATFEVRVGTPDGLSNPMEIRRHEALPVAATPPSNFDWNAIPAFEVCRWCTDGQAKFKIAPNTQELSLVPSDEFKFTAGEIVNHPEKIQITVRFQAEFEDGSKRDLGKTEFFEVGMARNGANYEAADNLKREIEKILNNGRLTCCDPPAGKIIGTTYVRLDTWPWIKCKEEIKIQLKTTSIPDCSCVGDAKKPAAAEEPKSNDGDSSSSAPSSSGSYFLSPSPGVRDVYSTIGSLHGLETSAR